MVMPKVSPSPPCNHLCLIPRRLLQLPDSDRHAKRRSALKAREAVGRFSMDRDVQLVLNTPSSAFLTGKVRVETRIEIHF